MNNPERVEHWRRWACGARKAMKPGGRSVRPTTRGNGIRRLLWANRVITLKEHKTARNTGQPRRIPIGRKRAEFLDQAIGPRTESPVLSSPSGRGWRVENLSRTYSRLRDLAGLPKDLVLYLARHECGTKICRGKGIEYARRLPGRSDISTTQRYMHLVDSELADAQDLIE